MKAFFISGYIHIIFTFFKHVALKIILGSLQNYYYIAHSSILEIMEMIIPLFS